MPSTDPPSNISTINKSSKDEFKLDLLKKYVSFGWPLLPIHWFDTKFPEKCSCGKANCKSPAKHPLIEGGVKNASLDPMQINRWHSRWPLANWAVRTGSKSSGGSGSIVIDIDPRHDGDKSWEAFIGEFPRLKTLVISTGGNPQGEHWYFKLPDDISIRSGSNIVGKGIDHKSDNSYCLVPPSKTMNLYSFANGDNLDDVSPLPKWIAKTLLNHPGDQPKTTPVGERVGDLVKHGEQDNALSSIIGGFVRDGYTPTQIHAMARAHVDVSFEDPHLVKDEIIWEKAKRFAKDYGGKETKKQTARSGSLVNSLVKLADAAEYFHTPNREPYAQININGHLETVPLRSRDYKHWLSFLSYSSLGKAASPHVLQSVQNSMIGKAVHDSPTYPVFMRVAEHEGTIYLDTANAERMIIKITPHGWDVISNPPVRFRRSGGMLPLSIPLHDGEINPLRSFINISDEDGWKLITSWLLMAFHPTGPYPILILHGEQGSAKSTTARFIRELVDPNHVPLRSFPRYSKDLFVSATHSWIQAFDNISVLKTWESDSICRLATGGGLSIRTLYTDDEEFLFKSKRPVLLNGIEEFASRGDLIDRSIVLYLPSIDPAYRKSERELEEAFTEFKPIILGGFLNAISNALRNINDLKLEKLERMADYCQWIAAAESNDHFKWDEGSMLSAYTNNNEDASALVRDSWPIVKPLEEFVQKNNDWSGTMTELLQHLGAEAGEKIANMSTFPKAPNKLSGQLRRLAPELRKIGISINFGSKGKKRIVRIVDLNQIGEM